MVISSKFVLRVFFELLKNFLREFPIKEIDLSKPILVTGGTGYMALWIIKLLLEKKCYVKATVRDKFSQKKVDHLLKIGTEYPGKLELFEADLLQSGSFEEAMADCELIIHTVKRIWEWNTGLLKKP